jgi:hypothetical protein
VGISGADFLAAALSQADTLDAATYSLTGGAKQTSWSQSPGPVPLPSPSMGEGSGVRLPTLDLRQLPEPQTLMFNGVDGVDDSLSLNLDTLPTDAAGHSTVKTSVYNGGAGAFDSMIVTGGHFKNVTYIPTG